MQGSAHLLFASEYVLGRPRQRRPIRLGLFGGLLDRVDWRSRRDAADQAAGWKHVCVSALSAGHFGLSLVLTRRFQLLFPVRVHHRLHPLPPRDRCPPQRSGPPDHRPDTGLSCSDRVVVGGRRKHSGGIGRAPEPSRDCSLPIVCVLYCHRVSLLYQLRERMASVQLWKDTERFVCGRAPRRRQTGA